MPIDTKRKAENDEPRADGSDYDSDDSEEPDFINVDFDFRAPEEIDFQALKRLLQQLFYTHNTKLDLSSLADHIVKTSATQGVGTTIKIVDDEDQDPYAFVSAIQLSSEKKEGSEAANSLTKYLLEVTNKPSNKSIHEAIKSAASPTSTNAPVIAVLHERMVNMPPQVAPPLYKMLLEEIRTALASTANPSHFLFFSRVFSADAFSDDEAMDEDEEDDDEPSGLAGARKRRAKLARKEAKKAGAKKDAPRARVISDGMALSGGAADEELGLFHPEDIAISKVASHSLTYRFPPPPDATDGFEAPLFGRVALVPSDKMDSLLQQIENDLSVPTPQ
ncbi:related to BCP1 - Essential protein involved in nuclear export of cytoskeleton organization protein [Melanopsichium pennsylvanicum]|uniref:Protein BCP1 n=2 Tax=Melanopsichium pennsylvanicum TaxID=63383 RepID=A0AAJ4XR17_9BASI|nr:related to BCP1-Essential protein involved in nuclear export of cytoskeleton organization protein [Melanopsichium pennsylvanicum 4]SNX87260.1 related to BCP1 - Essential protein involved in nuclear export of cytoskeleton organization protein [Melanopsichium pennsylvanicum]